jgi:hypothetical protein
VIPKPIERNLSSPSHYGEDQCVLAILHCPLENLCVLRVKNSVSIPVGPGFTEILTQRAQRFSRAHSRHWRHVDIASLMEKDLSSPSPEGEGDESRSTRFGMSMPNKQRKRLDALFSQRPLNYWWIPGMPGFLREA